MKRKFRLFFIVTVLILSLTTFVIIISGYDSQKTDDLGKKESVIIFRETGMTFDQSRSTVSSDVFFSINKEQLAIYYGQSKGDIVSILGEPCYETNSFLFYNDGQMKLLLDTEGKLIDMHYVTMLDLEKNLYEEKQFLSDVLTLEDIMKEWEDTDATLKDHAKARQKYLYSDEEILKLKDLKHEEILTLLGEADNLGPSGLNSTSLIYYTETRHISFNFDEEEGNSCAWNYFKNPMPLAVFIYGSRVVHDIP